MRTHRVGTDTWYRRYRRGLPTGKGGFTLIELLVVIAIISLLVGILLPSLGKAKDLAKAAMGAAQTRNMALAFLIYREDWDFLPWGASGAKPTPNPTPSNPEMVGVGGLYTIRSTIAIELEEKHGIDTVNAYTCPANLWKPRRWWAWSGADGPPAPRDPQALTSEVFYADDFCFYTYLDGKDLPADMRANYSETIPPGAYTATHNNLSSDHAMLGDRTLSISGSGTINLHWANTSYGGIETAYGDAHVEWTDIGEGFFDDITTSQYNVWSAWFYWWK